ncbi:hypothetical protein K438DRAFT_1757181 [Mycena galopus ATCC 62051]|nr:hypothetical protein K438DRAFT_1757181 [Mycena galopus ATCC 62051]
MHVKLNRFNITGTINVSGWFGNMHSDIGTKAPRRVQVWEYVEGYRQGTKAPRWVQACNFLGNPKQELHESPRILQTAKKWSQKCICLSLAGARGPAYVWASGLPHKIFGSACGRWGIPPRKWAGAPHPFCRKRGAPHIMWDPQLKTIPIGLFNSHEKYTSMGMGEG